MQDSKEYQEYIKKKRQYESYKDPQDREGTPKNIKNIFKSFMKSKNNDIK